MRNILTDVSGTAAKFKVTVSNILVSKVQTGIADQDPKIEVSVGQPSLDGLGSYSPSIEPTIDGDVENGYTLRMEFSGKLERGQTRIRGTSMFHSKQLQLILQTESNQNQKNNFANSY